MRRLMDVSLSKIRFFKKLLSLDNFEVYNIWLVVWLFGFYGLSTFVGYLMPNPFLFK